MKTLNSQVTFKQKKKENVIYLKLNLKTDSAEVIFMSVVFKQIQFYHAEKCMKFKYFSFINFIHFMK